ncbi:MAG TPA: BrnT family toxin [Pyrinomonadaceae bacterium]|nr:BrnT family toxin [Pyrinomonadaceae bacterium]
MRFEWDVKKASENFAKHGVTFYEAAEVFYDPNALNDYDSKHSTIEARFFIIGLSTRRLLFVVYIEPEADVVRIISARKAGRIEREVYEQ